MSRTYLVLLNPCHAFGAFSGVGQYPIRCFAFILALLGPCDHVVTAGRDMRFLSTPETEQHPALAQTRPQDAVSHRHIITPPSRAPSKGIAHIHEALQVISQIRRQHRWGHKSPEDVLRHHLRTLVLRAPRQRAADSLAHFRRQILRVARAAEVMTTPHSDQLRSRDLIAADATNLALVRLLQLEDKTGNTGFLLGSIRIGAEGIDDRFFVPAVVAE